MKRCTIHYDGDICAVVDATIQMSDPLTTIDGATKTADNLRELLESNENIHRASIYLDLNHAH